MNMKASSTLLGSLTPTDLSPMPLAERPEPPTYPLHALGPILGEAAHRLAHFVQTPPGMAGQSVLAAAALAVQGHIDVSRGSIGTGPTSLFFLTIAGSGERKSTLDKLALKPVRDYERELRSQFNEQDAIYRADLDAWEKRRSSVLKPYNSNQVMTELDQKALSGELAELERSKPIPTPRPSITFEEPTAEGVYRHLSEGRSTAGLFSDEGIGFFGGHGMSDENRGRSIALLSKLWDGSPVTRTRGASGESGVLPDCRLSAHLMIQPIIAEKVLADPLLVGQGFLARFLVSQEPPLLGKRMLGGRDPDEEISNDPAVRQFWDLLSCLIRQPLSIGESGELEPQIIRIEGSALQAWFRLHDSIEEQLGVGGELAEIRPFAAKAAENAARIAAILSYIEDYAGPTVAHIERAGELISYFIASMAVRTQEAHESAAIYEARNLLEWLRQRGGTLIAEDFNRLPAQMRRAKVARRLLEILTKHGYVSVAMIGPSGMPRAWSVDEGV